MEVAAIEVLLLDTLEKEGEDNRLFHACEHDVNVHSRWRDLRGVYAAAVGTMKSVTGEPLVTAEFKAANDTAEPTIVGFVDLNEVLFVMVFVTCELPQKITVYYTRTACELLVSLLGYPNQKLCDWREQTEALEMRLEHMCQSIFQCIRRDLRFETHLQFAFDGNVPTLTYPLDTMARLSAFQVIEPLSDTYEIEGFALFYRRMLVVAKTTPEILKLLSQWLLYDDFDTEADTGDGVSILRFKWFDAHYALYGVFPAIHSLVQIRHRDIQCFYLLRHPNLSAFEPYKLDPSAFISTEDLEELIRFADSRLKRHYDSTLAARRTEIVPDSPVWYCIVLDKLRQALHGFMPTELFSRTATSRGIDALIWKPMLELLACEPSVSFQRHRVFPSETQGNIASLPTRKHWIPPVKLDFNNTHALLLRPVRPEDDVGTDISSEEAQIFPPVHHQLENQAIASLHKYPGGELQQEAERVCLADDRLVWVVANYYEVFDLFAVCDDGISIERLEQEMNTLLKLD